MPVEHAILVKFNYGLDTLDALFELEDALTEALERAGVGEYDGNDIATDLSDGTLYMYGPDADALIAVAMPILKSAPFMKGARYSCRYGDAADPSAKEVQSII